MNTRLKDLIPILVCADVQASIRLYTDVLGFEILNEMKDVGRTGWASLRNGRVGLMLGSPHYLPEGSKVDGRYTQAIYYFYPEDVVALREAVISRGFEVSDLRVAFYGMKEFEMVDLDGHVLLFGQETDEPPSKA